MGREPPLLGADGAEPGEEDSGGERCVEEDVGDQDAGQAVEPGIEVEADE